jgi:hypothetical protein
MHPMLMLRTAAVLAATLLCGAAAHAATLAPAQTEAGCTLGELGNSVVISDPSACALDGSLASTSASLTLSPFVQGQVQAQFAGGVDSTSSAFVHISYAFEVIGGNPGDMVPLLIATNLSTRSTSSSSAEAGFASLDLHTGASGDSQVAVCTYSLCALGTEFSGTLAARAFSGDAGNTLSLVLSAGVGDSANAESSGASGDPYIYVDPSFADASKYSIAVSAGVGNAPAVPEPATTTLWAAGLVVLTVLAGRGGWRRDVGAVRPLAP